jgi:hypothetical protein
MKYLSNSFGADTGSQTREDVTDTYGVIFSTS